MIEILKRIARNRRNAEKYRKFKKGLNIILDADEDTERVGQGLRATGVVSPAKIREGKADYQENLRDLKELDGK